MLHDPTDETHRKPRQFRNTPVRRYIRLTSLVITLIYGVAGCYTFNKIITNPEYLKEYEDNQMSEDAKAMLEDYMSFPFLRGTIEKLAQRQQDKLNKEAELKQTELKEAEQKKANK
ncbi:hypothetical protein P5V15_012080 [Pogonomyrmex californicus]